MVEHECILLQLFANFSVLPNFYQKQTNEKHEQLSVKYYFVLVLAVIVKN